MRKVASALTAASILFGSTAAFAANDADQAALAPGNAAGIQEAQGMNTGLVMGVIAAAVVTTGIILVATGTGNKTSSTTQTTPR